MSLSLVEALEQVGLDPGRVYYCQVKGLKVELRVLTSAEPETLSALDESDVMLDPWVELPQPTAKFSVVGEFGALPLPDPPVIPDDGEEF